MIDRSNFRAWVTLIALIFVVKAADVRAQQTSFNVSDNGAIALMDGMITESTAIEFSGLIAANRALKVLILNSPGGQVVPALDISAVVNTMGIATFVPKEASCSSACSIIFFSGSDRFAEGQLGVHQMSNVDASGVQLLLAEILDAFERYGVDRRISRHMLTTLPDDMYFFNDLQKAEYGINRNDEDLVAAEPVVQSRARIDYASYPPEAYFDSKEAIRLPDFSGRDGWARNFRTRIRNGLSAGPNFAGHFSMIEIGCGTSCRFAFVADAKNGEVFSFPYGGEEQYEMELLFNANSRLVKVTWMQDSGTCIQQDLVFDGRDFEVVAEVTFARLNFCK